MPSIKIVESSAFAHCRILINVKFGKDLESIRGGAFLYCTSLERINLPLKNGMFDYTNDAFQYCDKFNHIDLATRVLHETIAALLLEEWKHDIMKKLIQSIRFFQTQ